MDRPTCKLCFRRFPNGRALGGHMRSHAPSAATRPQQQQAARRPRGSGGGLATSPTSSSSSGPHQPSAVAAAAAATKIHTPASYGLRENPRKSAKLADPEFSNPDVVYDDDNDLTGYYYGNSSSYYHQNQHHQYSSSAVVQDGESETESSMAAAAGAVATGSKTTASSFRRRSKRRRRGDSIRMLFPATTADAGPTSNNRSKKHQAQDEEQAPVSSVSDATPDEDVALCLVMLSRDAWSVKEEEEQQQQHRELAAAGDEEEASYDDEMLDGEEDDDDDDMRIAGSGSRCGGGGVGVGGRSRFRCGTCKKTFRSYQALGGHRASHKKASTKPWNAQHADDDDNNDADQYHYFHKQQRHPSRVDRIRREQGAVDDYSSEATGSAAAAPVGAGVGEPRIHQCPFCSRVFASGQALGGHKRSHFTYSAPHHQHYSSSYLPAPAAAKHPDATERGGNANGASPAGRNNTSNNSSRKGGSFPEQLGESFLDLNLPAPVDELDAEVSAVSIAN